MTPIDARRRGRYRALSGWESSHVICCSADVLRRIFVSDDTRAAIKWLATMATIVWRQRPRAYPALDVKIPRNLTSGTGRRLRAAQVLASFPPSPGLGRSMIYQLESRRGFTSRVRTGLRVVGWMESEVQLWLASRIDHHRAGVN